jgi:hypothetical protein
VHVLQKVAMMIKLITGIMLLVRHQVMNIYLIKQRFGVHIVEKFGIFSLQDLNALKVIIK